jgi:hypothetical protein
MKRGLRPWQLNEEVFPMTSASTTAERARWEVKGEKQDTSLFLLLIAELRSLRRETGKQDCHLNDISATGEKGGNIC